MPQSWQSPLAGGLILPCWSALCAALETLPRLAGSGSTSSRCTLVRTLGRPDGGFIAKWYGDPAGAGHTPEAIDAMCREFLRLSREHASRRAGEA
jgi:hypothetical protein